MSFVHLHTHSTYSLLESSASIDQLVETAVAQGSNALALTDENNCSGLYEFHELCLKSKIKPILGMQINVVKDISSTEEDEVAKSIIILAKNKVGWKNLCVLSSEAYLTGFYRTPRIDYKILQKYSEGLILLTGGMDGHLANRILYNKIDDAKFLLGFYKKIFGEDVYIEVSFHPSTNNLSNESLQKKVLETSIALADEYGIKCVCTNEIKYAKKEKRQVLAQDVLLCIKQHKTRKDDRRELPCQEYYMKKRDALEPFFPGRQDFFDNTLEVAAKIENSVIDKGIDLLPKFQTPDGSDPSIFLRGLVEDGLKKKGLDEKKEYRDRIDWELRVFETCGFVNYFLVLNEFVSWARSNGISMGPGRGSSVGSLALYCLNVTKLDPIKYGLLFERFFSVDTKYILHSSMFGFSFAIPKIEVSKSIVMELYACSKKHPEFDNQRFMSEGKKMRSMKCWDDFVRIFSFFIENKMPSGNSNNCNSVIAYYSGMVTERPLGAFEPQEELAAARVSPPDVDLDFDITRRDEIFIHLRDVYGTSKFAQIGTANGFKGKASIKDVGKALDIGNDWEENQKIKKEKEQAKIKGEKIEEREKSRKTLDEVDYISGFAETGLSFKEAYDSSPDLRNKINEGDAYYEICSQFDGLIRQFSIHAAGAVICNRDLKEVLPLRIVEDKTGDKESYEDDEGNEIFKNKRLVCTQWDKNQVESIGLFKYDLLGVKNISIIRKTMDLLKADGIEFDIDLIEPTDPKVLKMISDGKTAGIFQFETRSQTDLVKLIGVDEFNDMVAINAINRPGPKKAGVGDKYSARKRGEEEIEYPHPSMEPVLKNTYGLLIYQEQVMNLSRVMAGFTKSESDKLRKHIGKKDIEKLDALRGQFIEGCENNGIEKATAIDVWQTIYNFGEYGFNLSHSLAYSYIGYQEAYLKCYYPLQFFCSLMSFVIGDKEKFDAYRLEAAGDERLGIKGLGVKLWPVHINKSRAQYYIDNKGLRLPLTIVEGVGESAVKAIMQAQPFTDFEDFVQRVDTRAVTCAVVKNLARIKYGAFACFGISEKEAVEKFELMKKDIGRRKMNKNRFVNDNVFRGIPMMPDRKN